MIEAPIGQVVVVDLDGPYVAIGTLVEVDTGFLALADVDLHDLREANSTTEVYVLETRRLGVRANRARVLVPRHRVVALSRLDDTLA